MRKVLFILILTTLTEFVFSQTTFDLQFLKETLSTDKVEITTMDITKTLTDPPYWKLLGLYKDGIISTLKVNNGFWFGKDGLYFESPAILKKYGSLKNNDLSEGIWSFDNKMKTLTIEFNDNVNVYKVIRLNAVEIIIEDNTGTRFFFSAQSEIRNAPYILQNKLSKNLTSGQVKENWVKGKDESNLEDITALDSYDFSDSLALVLSNVEPVPGEINYGYRENKKDYMYRYINIKGETVIKLEPKYEQAFSFSNGYALLTSNFSKSEALFINKKGENAFSQSFINARSFVNGFAVVEAKWGQWGFIDTTGAFISTHLYEYVGDFKEGIARVRYKNKWGFIDTTGNEFVIPQFESASDFSEGLAFVSKYVENEKQYFYIDKTGKIIIRNITPVSKMYLNEDKIEIPLNDFHNGMALIQNEKGDDDIFIDKSGKGIIRLKIGAVFYHFINRYSIASMHYIGKYGFLNMKGKLAIKAQFDDVGNFSEGLARVAINKNWGFIDTTGTVIINKDILKPESEIQTSPKYDYVSDFSEGLAIVEARQREGYIDKTGNWVIKPIFVEAHHFINGIARVKFANRKGWNYIDKNGNILFKNLL